MGETFSIVVPDSLAGERIDRAVALLTGVSRREVADLLVGRAVTVDGRVPAKASTRLEAGSTVSVTMPEVILVDPADPSVEVEVVYSDSELIVVNKPAGLVVHPGAGTPDGTMVNGLLARFPDLAGVGEKGRPGIVHRLDKGTTGLLMVARTESAYRSLVGQLASRQVRRHYQTLVWGEVESSEGLIDAPIGRSNRDATVRAVVASGREARTRYRVVARYREPDTTLLECRLETGRTHQIRVHLTAIGHPVVGDNRYGPSDSLSGLERPFLHAASLGFKHPASGDEMDFSAELPADLVGVLAGLSAARSAPD